MIIKRYRPMHGSLIIKAKARLIYEKPKLSLNDPRSKTINDQCEEVLLKIARIKSKNLEIKKFLQS